MLNSDTRRRIDACRDVLVGKIPDPKGQVEQITLALMYKFMNDMDREAEDLGGTAQFFSGDYAEYSWDRITDKKLGGEERIRLYSAGIEKVNENPDVPELFREIFKNAYLPYRDPETFNLFAKEISAFRYDHSEDLGDAFEYLLSIMSSQGEAGQFRTPRHVIDFMADVVEPKLAEKVLDPACGTAGFLIAAYKRMRASKADLSPAELEELHQSVAGYDISPDMVRLSRVNLYLHQFAEPAVHEYDTLTDQARWAEKADVILANPPFMTPKGGIRPHKKFGIASNRSEVLFVDYIMEHLEAAGRAAVIVPEGIIFQSATAYRSLRALLLDGRLWAVASLPAGVFNPYSGVKTSILFMDRALARGDAPLLFVKIEADGYDLGAQRRANGKDDLPAALSLLRDVRGRLRSGTLPSDFHGSLDGHSLGHLVVPRSIVLAEADKNLSMERYRPKIASGPKKWPMVKLGEVCEFINGRAFKPEEWENATPNGYPIIRIQNLNNPKMPYNYFSGQVPEKILIYPGDLLFSWSGSRGTSFGAHIWSNGQGILNQHIFKVLHSSKLNRFYLWLVLNKAVEVVEQNLHGGVGLVHITKGNLERIEIPLPPLSIQEEIVAEVKRYQAVIDGARAVTENWRPSFAVDPDWPMVKLGEVCEVTSGGTPDRSKPEYWGGSIPWVKTGEINYEEIKTTEEFITQSGLDNSSAKVIKAGSILMAMYGQGVTRGKVAILGIDATINQACAALRIKDSRISRDFLFIQLSSAYEHFRAISDARGGNQSNLNAQLIRDYFFSLPPLPVQKEIVARIEEERSLVEANERLIALMKKRIEETVARVWN